MAKEIDWGAALDAEMGAGNVAVQSPEIDWGAELDREDKAVRRATFAAEAEAFARERLGKVMFPNVTAWGVGLGSSVVAPTARAIGMGERADQLQMFGDAYRKAAAERDQQNTIVPPIVSRGLRGAAESLPPMILAGRLAGPYGALGTAGVLEADKSITEGRSAGLEGGKLAAYAGTQGVIEAGVGAIFQKMGLGGAESLAAGKAVVSRGLGAGLKQLGIGTVNELREEVATELGHSLVDKLSEVDPNATSPEAIQQTIADTTVQTLLTMGALGGVQAAGQYQVGQQRKGQLEQTRQQRGSDQAALEQLATPEVVQQWVNANPEAAQRVAAKDSLSRADWQSLGLTQRSSAAARKAFADSVKSIVTPVQEEVQDAEAIRGAETEVRPVEGGQDVRGPGQEQVPAEPAGEVAPARPEVQVGEPTTEPPADLARRAARGESIARPEGISDARWRVMIAQQAKRMGLKPPKPIEPADAAGTSRPPRGEPVASAGGAVSQAPSTAPATETREPWQMTGQEYFDSLRTANPSISNSAGPISAHRSAVKSAIASGKPVPPEVLADYPDLQPKQQLQPEEPNVPIEGTTPATGTEAVKAVQPAAQEGVGTQQVSRTVYRAERRSGDIKEGPSLGTWFTRSEKAASHFAQGGKVETLDLPSGSYIRIVSDEFAKDDAITVDRINQQLADNGVAFQFDPEDYDEGEDREAWRWVDEGGKKLVASVRKAGFEGIEIDEGVGVGREVSQSILQFPHKKSTGEKPPRTPQDAVTPQPAPEAVPTPETRQAAAGEASQSIKGKGRKKSRKSLPEAIADKVLDIDEMEAKEAAANAEYDRKVAAQQAEVLQGEKQGIGEAGSGTGATRTEGVGPSRRDLASYAQPGKEGKLALAGQQPRPVRYYATEDDGIVPSHDARRNFSKNPEGDLNERPYQDPKEGASSRAVVEDIAKADPAKIDLLTSDTLSATDGPPVTNSQGIVLGGNARSMGIQLAYHQGGETAKRMKQAMVRAAEKFGLDPAAVEKMERPVIVRELADAGQRGEMSSILNEPLTAGKSQATIAASRGSKLSDSTVEVLSAMMAPDSDGNIPSVRDVLRSARNSDRVLRSLQSDGVLSERDTDQYVDPDTSQFNDAGRAAVEELLLGKVVGDPSIIGDMAPSVRNKVISAVGPLVRGMADKTHGERFTQVVRDTIAALPGFQASGRPAAQYFMQQKSLLGDMPGMGDETVAILADNFTKLGPVKFRAAIKEINESLGVESGSKQSSLFGNVNKATSFDEAVVQQFGRPEKAKSKGAKEAPSQPPTPSLAGKSSSQMEGIVRRDIAPLGAKLKVIATSEGSSYYRVVTNDEDEAVLVDKVRFSDHAARPNEHLSPDWDLVEDGDVDAEYDGLKQHIKDSLASWTLEKQQLQPPGGEQSGASAAADTAVPAPAAGEAEPVRQKSKGKKPRQGGTSASASFREGSSAAAGDTFTKTEADPAGAFVSKLKGIQVPELVSLARELMGGKLPIVGGLRKYLGLFKGMEGVSKSTRILLNPSIAKDERQLAAVLAHEIGHLVDFLPDATMKRGNILGRIATLRDHLKGYMANKPGGLGELTSKDRARLKRLAEKLASKGAEIEIDEEIRTTMPVTPEQIMAIWNSVDTSKLNPRLYQYIKTLSSAEKKSIVMEAIRGKVPDILKQYGEVKVEKTGRKIKQIVKIDPAEIAAKYQEMVEEEIRKRELLSNAIIRKELIALTKWWSGDYAGGSYSYKSYRESSKELYAEALSVFLTTPGELESRAPMFWKGFTNYIGSKPDVLNEYLAVQDMLNGVPAELALDRSRRIRGMFTKGDEAIRAANAARDGARQSVFESVRQFLGQYILDSHSPVKRRVAMAEKKNAAKFDDADNAKYILDELHSIDSPNHVMLSRIQREVYKPLLDAGFTRDDMGEYLFLKRVVNERNEIMNPLGFTPETSGEQLGQLRERLGSSKFDQLHRAMQAWHNIIFESVEEAVETGVYSRRTFEETIKPNKDNYATFAVTHYLENDAHISAGIFEQVGTLQEVANPLDATHMKTITLNRLIQLNRAKNSVRDLLLREFPSEIVEVPIPYGSREPSKPAPAGSEYMIVLEDGKPHAYQVPQEIAKSLMRHDIGGLSKIGRLLESAVYKVFHPLFVTYNPGFQVHNPIRDLRRTHLNLSAIGTRLGKEISLAEVLKAYWDSKGAAWRRARGLHDDVIERMMKERAIDIPFVSVDSTTVGDETTIGGHSLIKGPTDLLLEGHGLSDSPKERGRIMKVLGPIGDVIEGVGVFQETISKVAGYKILEKRSVGKRERAFIVRKYVGTPDYKQRGLATGLTNSLYMYSKVRWNGLQFDSELATSADTAAGYWWRRMVWTVMPTTVTKVAAAGLLGPAVAAMFAAIPKYFLDNYDVWPLGWIKDDDDDDDDEDKGKVAFITIPQDDTGRFLKQVWSHILDIGIEASGGETRSSGLNEIAGDLFGDVKAELFPSFNPIIDISLKWAEYATDINPRDAHFGSDIVSPTEWDARYSDAWPARKKMLAWTFDKFGVLSTIGRAVTGPAVGNPFDSDSETVVEQSVRMTPGLDRMIRISDRGLSEKEWSDMEAEEAEAAAFRLSLPKQVRDSTKYLYKLRNCNELTQTEFIEKETISAWYNEAYMPLTEIMKDESSTPDQVKAAREKLSDATTNMKDLYAAKAMRSIIGTNKDGSPKGKPQRQPGESVADYQARYNEWLDRRAKATEAYGRLMNKRQ